MILREGEVLVVKSVAAKTGFVDIVWADWNEQVEGVAYYDQPQPDAICAVDFKALTIRSLDIEFGDAVCAAIAEAEDQRRHERQVRT